MDQLSANRPWPLEQQPPWPSHGGQRDALLAHFGLHATHAVLDFSTNLNPLGPPSWVSEKLVAAFAGLPLYPDPTYARATSAIAAEEEFSATQVCLTNGGSEAIFLAASLFAGQKAAILQPAFGEYARACQHYQIEVTELTLTQPDFTPDEVQIFRAMQQQDLLFIARPNNPSATLIPLNTLSRWLEQAEQSRCTLIIDEAFIDFCDPAERHSSRHLHLSRHLILLRSMTKLYTLPGLRLGYILTHEALIRQLKARQMPWSVNHLAAELVAPLLADHAFVQQTVHWLSAEIDWLLPQLRRLGYRIPTPAANFFLLQDDALHTTSQSSKADRLFQHLLQQGILARHTHNFTGLNGEWLRLAIRSREENHCLLTALQSWRESAC